MSDNIEGTVPQSDMLSDDQLDAVAGGVLYNDGSLDMNTGTTAPTSTTSTAPVKTASTYVVRTSTTTATTTSTNPQTTYTNATNTALSGLRSIPG
ncbi:hypothetical protein [Gemmatimonas sp.]|uniref:hypothetical protein n=1 Tax=Gemmatimonas sp. TaxID=1962908 RepID=UPI00286E7AF1|nr:hypothetical protein [Gemmatimonas sp.]